MLWQHCHSAQFRLRAGQRGISPSVYGHQFSDCQCLQMHGPCARIYSLYFHQLFILAAVMYVNDMDLLHWPSSPSMTPEELIEYVQDATTDWGNLSQASGGILKPAKCSVYLMLYKYINGRAQLKSVLDLPPPVTYINEGVILFLLHITIPQPDGPAVGIATHDVSTASKMLVVHFSPAGNSATHVKHVVQKGLDWADCLQTKPLPCHDTWLSFYLQLFPAISWGLIMVCLTPCVLDTMIQHIYAKALPSHGVKRKIKKQWQTLP
jgi:hypothetical protein